MLSEAACVQEQYLSLNKPHGSFNKLSRLLLQDDMEEIEAYTHAAQGSAQASR